ncbi:MAG: hypothetical protein ACLS6G_05365 [Christensenellales bacterium]
MFNRLFGSEPLFTTALCANACPPPERHQHGAHHQPLFHRSHPSAAPAGSFLRHKDEPPPRFLPDFEKSGLFRSFRLIPIVPRIAGEKKDDCRPKLHKKYHASRSFDKTKFPPCFRVYAFPCLYYTIHKFIFTTGEEAAA